MKFLQRAFVGLLILVLATPAFSQSAALAPYTDNPLAEFLAHQRYHTLLGLQADTASNDHGTFTLIGGMGYFPMEQLAVGLYGSVRNSDRRLPYRMKQIYGFGLFSEYNFAPGATLQPTGGLRFGILDSTGPSGDTSVHAAALAGLKLAINQNLALSIAGVLNWAQDDMLDYKENADGSASSSNTDIGIEVGLRFGF